MTGALQLLRGASYRVSLAYREATSTTADVQQLCTSQCEVCRLAGEWRRGRERTEREGEGAMRQQVGEVAQLLGCC